MSAHVLILTFSKQTFNESLDFCSRLNPTKGINMGDSYQAHLPMHYALNIEFIRLKLHWCCN